MYIKEEKKYLKNKKKKKNNKQMKKKQERMAFYMTGRRLLWWCSTGLSGANYETFIIHNNFHHHEQININTNYHIKTDILIIEELFWKH